MLRLWTQFTLLARCAQLCAAMWGSPAMHRALNTGTVWVDTCSTPKLRTPATHSRARHWKGGFESCCSPLPLADQAISPPKHEFQEASWLRLRLTQVNRTAIARGMIVHQASARRFGKRRARLRNTANAVQVEAARIAKRRCMHTCTQGRSVWVHNPAWSSLQSKLW